MIRPEARKAFEMLDAAAEAGFIRERPVLDGAWKNPHAAATVIPPGSRRVWRPAPGGSTCQGCGAAMPDTGGIRLYCGKRCKQAARTR